MHMHHIERHKQQRPVENNRACAIISARHYAYSLRRLHARPIHLHLHLHTQQLIEREKEKNDRQLVVRVRAPGGEQRAPGRERARGVAHVRVLLGDLRPRVARVVQVRGRVPRVPGAAESGLVLTSELDDPCSGRGGRRRRGAHVHHVGQRLSPHELHPLRKLHLFSIGYFLCDLIIIIVWPVPMQYVFIIHHLVAVIPYFINNFISCCAASQYGLLLFLLVELATLPLNARGFIESVGREDTKNHTRSIYVTYVIWAITRTALPIYLVYVFWAYAYPPDRNHDVCLYPNLVGAHVIALFCVGVFFFVHTPEIIARWKADEAKAAGGDGLAVNDGDEEEATGGDAQKSCPVSLSISLSRRNKDAVVDDSYDDVELGVLPRSARAS